MSGERFVLINGVWRRPGWAPVAPGGTALDPTQPAPPPAAPRLRILDLALLGTGAVTGPGDPPSTSQNFIGDPGVGKYLLGVALGPNGNASLAAARQNAHYQGNDKTSVVHNYAGDSNVKGSMLDEAHNAGMIASQVFRLPNTGTPAQNAAAVLAGTQDANIDASAETCMARAPKKIWLTFYHEPRSEFTTAAAQDLYRRAYRYVVFRFRARGVTNVSFMPIIENPNTFANDNPLKWHADWDGTSLAASSWHDELTMDMFGIDTYNPLPVDDLIDGKKFSTMMGRVVEDMDKPGYPVWDYVMPEFGMSNRMTVDRPAPGMTNWTQWAQDAVDTAIAERVKAFIYWDNAGEIGRYSFGPRPSNVPQSGVSPCSNCSPATSYDTVLNKKVGWDLIANHPARVKVTA